jgi:predicted aspartyl protease
MENLIAEIRELQIRQQTIMNYIKATRVDQEEMAAIKAGEAEMTAAMNHVKYAQAHFEGTERKRIQSLVASIDQRMQILRAISKQQAFNIGLAKQLTEAEDRVRHKSSGKAAICLDRGRPLLPGTMRLMSLPYRDTPQKDFPEDRPKPQKREYTGENELLTSCPPRHNETPVWKVTHSNLKAMGWIGDKPCIMTVDTGASVTIARPDIVAGLPEREAPKNATLRTISGQPVPILKEALVKLTLGKQLLIIWVFVANTTEEFTLGLDVLYKHNAVVDLSRKVLRLGHEEVSLRIPSDTKDNSKAAERRRVRDASLLLKSLADSYKQSRKGGFMGRPSS